MSDLCVEIPEKNLLIMGRRTVIGLVEFRVESIFRIIVLIFSWCVRHISTLVYSFTGVNLETRCRSPFANNKSSVESTLLRMAADINIACGFLNTTLSFPTHLLDGSDICLKFSESFSQFRQTCLSNKFFFFFFLRLHILFTIYSKRTISKYF